MHSNNKVKISAVAISFNEEDNVDRYIKGVSFADEIIILDSYSTDKTVEKAKKSNAQVFQRKFDDFSSQKNHAITLAKNDWIVFFDFDEVISDDLKNEIVRTVNSNRNEVAYSVKRDFYFMNKKLSYNTGQKSKIIRLFNKNFCTYKGLVSEVLITEKKVGYLKNNLDHYNYKDFDSYTEKLNMHSKLQANHLYNQKVRPNAYHFFIKTFCKFFYQYFLKLGILDGKEGFIVSYLHSFAVFNSYLYLWTMYRKID